MEHTVEEVRALFEVWAEENGYEVLRIEPDYNDGFTAAAWHGYQAAYAKRIEADEVAADYPECSGDPSSCPENEGHGCCKPNPPAQTKQVEVGNTVLIDRGALRMALNVLRRAGKNEVADELEAACPPTAERVPKGDLEMIRQIAYFLKAVSSDGKWWHSQSAVNPVALDIQKLADKLLTAALAAQESNHGSI